MFIMHDDHLVPRGVVHKAVQEIAEASMAFSPLLAESSGRIYACRGRLPAGAGKLHGPFVALGERELEFEFKDDLSRRNLSRARWFDCAKSLTKHWQAGRCGVVVTAILTTSPSPTSRSACRSISLAATTHRGDRRGPEARRGEGGDHRAAWLRGVGKTTLAAAYAELHKRDYRATWWISAETEATMRADLVALGARLGWAGADEKEEPALAAVRERLRDEGEGLLLIYDNAIDAGSVRPYLPLSGLARVLVTSNAPAWRAIATLVEIAVWPKDIGADYLIARTGREKERAEAEVLSETLGGLPLAHEQAAAYCERMEFRLTISQTL